MNLKTLVTAGILLSGFFSSHAQKSSGEVKFGDVTAADFAPKIYSIDSTARAVILYDGGNAKYEGNDDSWFDINYTYHTRIRILNKSAFDAATVEIPLYKSNDKWDEIEKLEAVTYTLENGVVVKTSLDRSSVYKDKASADMVIKKFTFPNLKEGCIIEYSYKIISPRSFNLRGWLFQGQYPVLRSEYETAIPTVFNYVFLNSGYYDLQPSTDETVEQFHIFFKDNSSAQPMGSNINYPGNVIHSKWSLSDLPAMVKEKYTTTVRNYISKIEFQLRSVNIPGAEPHLYMHSWDQLTEDMLKDENFGKGLSEKNSWMDDDINKLIVKTDSLQTAQKIFAFVRQNFSCEDHDAKYMPGTIKDAYKAKKGNVAEVNLVLTAMLRKAGIRADPALLSTRDHGMAYEEYPLIGKFNYVFTRAMIGDKQYLLDASQKRNGFNYLPDYCYNGYARIIAPPSRLIPLFADSLKETKTTLIFINNSEDGKNMLGTFNSNLGYYESSDLRDNLAASGKADYFKKIKAAYSFDMDMQNEGIDSLAEYDEPVSVHYDFSYSPNEDIIYFNPLLTEAYKNNPFSATVRNYPVEMPYMNNELIIANIEIPKGYKVDELPASEKLTLNGTDGRFEYIISADTELIQLKCVMTLNRATFAPDEYETLRRFFTEVVKKEAEQIVFKKIK